MECSLNQIERAIHLAVTSHEGQKDKGGKPYILHVLRVGLAGKTESEMVTGFLHDLIEDTDYPVGRLGEFGKEIYDAVLSVSHAWIVSGVAPGLDGGLCFQNPRKGWKREGYEQQIARAKANPIGREVKYYDLLDNLSPARLDQLKARERRYLYFKYRVALHQLGHEVIFPGNE